MKILLVDDNDSCRESLKSFLEQHSYEVISARDGKEGLELAAIHKPELIISDGLMPNMDGFEFLRKIRTSEDLRSIPFIFTSGYYTGSEERELVLSLGANAFVPKPIEPKKLWNKILKVLAETKDKTIYNNNKPILSEYDVDYLQKYNQILSKKLLEFQSKRDFNQKRYLNLFSSMRDVIAISNSDRKIMDVNQPAMKEIFGYESEELIGKSSRVLFAEDKDFVYTGREVYNAKEYINGRILEVNYRRKNGEIFPAEVHALKLVDENGELTGNIGVIRDITKRKTAEESLKESKQQYQSLYLQFNNLINAMPDCITLLSPDSRLLWANQTCLKTHNKEMQEIMGQHCYELWHGRNEPCDTCPAIESMKTGQPAMAHITTPDNHIWEVRTIPVKNDTDKAMNIIHVVRDTTDHRKLEEQLRQSQKMEAIGQLAGGIAHDFNNILTAVVGYASLIQMKTMDDDPAQHYAKLILSLTDRASELTQSLLAFSRKQIINIKPVNINNTIKNFEKILLRVIGEDIELKTMLSDEPDLIAVADEGQIEHVLMNLTTNAKDSMPDGGILTISTALLNVDYEFIKTHGYGKPGKYILISVEDNGIGIDERHKDKIFEPFFTTKEVGKGTGLGLSMVYGIIKQHQGYINVYSEVGKGTTFNIYLPFEEMKIIEKDAQKESIIKGGVETILLAEDDAGVRSGIKAIIEKFGYKVIEALDGEDAVNKFIENSDKIDLVLIDVIMPKKNGREAYKEMQKIKPDLKVIFTSGYTANIIHKKGILEEGLHFIAKPIMPNKLLHKLREVLDKS